jgi:hypothetical protein
LRNLTCPAAQGLHKGDISGRGRATHALPRGAGHGAGFSILTPKKAHFAAIEIRWTALLHTTARNQNLTPKDAVTGVMGLVRPLV